MSGHSRHRRPTIGVLAGWQFAWTPTPLSYLTPIFSGASSAAHSLGCNLLLGCGMGPWTSRGESLRPAWPSVSDESDFVPIGPFNADGLVAVCPLHSEARSRYLQELIATGYPVIFVAAGERGPTIAVDNRNGILTAMRHLAEHGHRSIAFIAGSPDDLQGDTGERLDAYHSAVSELALLDNPSLVAWGHHRYDGGYRALQELVASSIPFTALLASNDESALGAMRALREGGHRIPEDVAIVGFDDRPESAVQVPPLSSVRIPLREMGHRAVESLYRYLVGESETIESARVETHFVARASCGCSLSRAGSTVLDAAESQAEPALWTDGEERLVQAMATSVLDEAWGPSVDQAVALCDRLLTAFRASLEQGDGSAFENALQAVLDQAVATGEEPHGWQAAISRLHEALGSMTAGSRMLAQKILDEARIMISASVQRQSRQHVVGRRWMLNRLGTLTARLLAARDETRLYDILAQHLPAMDIKTAWLARFEPAGDDPVAWTTLRDILSSQEGLERRGLRFPSREFPPGNLQLSNRPYRLALFPLTGPRGLMGYAVFDTADLELYGAITQQLATALNSVQLYREAKEGRRLAEEANALKSRFLSTVSHELRTPLNLIVGLSSILLQESDEGDISLPERYHSDVTQIYANAQHLGDLISDVLDLASSDAGQLRLANELVDLGQELHLVAETGRRLAYDKGLDWHTRIPESGPYVWVDRTRLRQVVLNLVNNAVKFTARGSVSLELQSTEDSVTVTVRDTGLGIPRDEQLLIFEEFHRSERSIERGHRGLGLGLAICKRLVEMHGGTIGLESSGDEGAGSSFFFTLPTVKPPVLHVQPSDTPTLTEEWVLVLSDRASSGARLQHYLEARGFDVKMVFVHENPDWLSQVVMSPPGAIVVDVSASAHQGWGVLKAVKGHPRTQDLPVLFCALSSEGGSVLEFDYLTKPIELAELTRALDQQWLVPKADRDKTTVLVVDDDPQTLDMHVRVVRAHSQSHRVVTARNGLEALDAMRRQRIDLVVLDLMMPEMDGFGVLEAMREDEGSREIPVIVLTGQVLTESEISRLNQGVTTVMGKGLFSLDETLARIDAALARQRALSGEAQRLVRQAMAFIHEHYAEPISRTDLAEYVALSEDYLTSCFRKELGLTPIAYLNRYRVNQAKQLLADPLRSITDIALEVGFSDSNYFSRVFRREVGVSPTAYRHAL